MGHHLVRSVASEEAPTFLERASAYGRYRNSHSQANGYYRNVTCSASVVGPLGRQDAVAATVTLTASGSYLCRIPQCGRVADCDTIRLRQMVDLNRRERDMCNVHPCCPCLGDKGTAHAAVPPLSSSPDVEVTSEVHRSKQEEQKGATEI